MTEELSYEVYSPTSVIGIFNNALKLPATITLIYLKEVGKPMLITITITCIPKEIIPR